MPSLRYFYRYSIPLLYTITQCRHSVPLLFPVTLSPQVTSFRTKAMQITSTMEQYQLKTEWLTNHFYPLPSVVFQMSRRLSVVRHTLIQQREAVWHQFENAVIVLAVAINSVLTVYHDRHREVPAPRTPASAPHTVSRASPTPKGEGHSIHTTTPEHMQSQLPCPPPLPLYSTPFCTPPAPHGGEADGHHRLRREGSKGRAANGDRPIGVARCRQEQHTKGDMPTPLPP